MGAVVVVVWVITSACICCCSQFFSLTDSEGNCLCISDKTLPHHIHCVATLPCEILKFRKKNKHLTCFEENTTPLKQRFVSSDVL